MKRFTKRMALAATALALGAPATLADGFRLNEIYASHTGIDDMEFLEIVGTPGASMAGIVVVIVEGDAGSSCATCVDGVWDLSAFSMPLDGYFVLGNTAVPGIDLDIGSDNIIENGTETFYIIETTDVPGLLATAGTNVDPDADLISILPGFGRVHDLVAMTDGGLGDQVLDGACVIGPDGSFFPAGIFRDGDYAGSWCSESFLDFDDVTNLAEPSTAGGPNSACPGPETVAYCVSGTSASGCTAKLWTAGVPSATAASGFCITADCLEGAKDGIFFYGTNGQQANSWGTGTSFQCVVPPVQRAGLQTGSGTTGTCDGRTSQDLTALWTAKPSKNPGLGAVVQAQFWYRDPLNTSSQTTSLSNAVEFTVKP